MDRRGEVLRAFPGVVAALLFACACTSAPEEVAASPPKASDIRALRWVAPGADKVRALTTRPVACLRKLQPGDDVIVIDRVVTNFDERSDWGRIAFESPALLGGAAARMSLSCSSCHLNGRGNQDFFVEGVSGEPGTADVTSSLFSKVRGDGMFNPVPIPDLAMRDGGQTKDRKDPEFWVKVHGLIVDEFDGQEPPASMFSMILDYLDRLSANKCANPGGRGAVTADADAQDASTALRAAGRFAESGMIAEALLMARASRGLMERLHERFAAPDQSGVRKALVTASREVEGWARKVRAGERSAPPQASLAAALVLAREHAAASLYNPDLLRAALEK